MSENREEILADFQACTGIDDVAEAIFHLDETNWDLLRAVSRVMPPDTQSFRHPEPEPQRHSDPDIMVVDDYVDVPSAFVHKMETGTDMTPDVANNIGHSRPKMPRPVAIVRNNHHHPHLHHDLLMNNSQQQQPSTSSSGSSSSRSKNTNASSSSNSGNGGGGSSIGNAGSSTSTSGSSKEKMLKFNVQYCDRIVSVELPESANINDLKIRLFKELKVAPCRQLLSGWARLSQYENTPFSKLMLPNENGLLLTIKQNEGGFTADDDAEIKEKLTGSYKLNVRCDEKDKTYHLNYPGTQNILKVKADVYSLTNIPVRNQIWSGWPPNIDDQTMLALSGINYPEHDLIVKRTSPSASSASNHSKDNKKQTNAAGTSSSVSSVTSKAGASSNTAGGSSSIVQIDSDEEEFEDASSETFNVDDDYFVDSAAPKRTEPLIPENIEDEIVGTISFSEQFTARYGPVHPAFFQGTLEEAIKEACAKPAAERKILAIYLHHDASVLTNVFCTQLLGYESVMQTFENNFILYGWDLTFESNRTRLQGYVYNALGATAAMSLRTIPVDRLPALVLIMRIRSSTDIFSVINGNVGVNELLSSLIEAVEVFAEHQRVEMAEEQERAERELVKWEQDEAYRESLAADRAKEEARRQQAEAESEARRKVEDEIAQESARKEAHRKEVEARLPPEPPLTGSQGDSITKIRFRLPKGQSIERRFQVNTPLKILFDFLTVEGYPSEEYKVISSWPRRDLTSLDKNQTLKELKLCPQETVILEER